MVYTGARGTGPRVWCRYVEDIPPGTGRRCSGCCGHWGLRFRALGTPLFLAHLAPALCTFPALPVTHTHTHTHTHTLLAGFRFVFYHTLLSAGLGGPRGGLRAQLPRDRGRPG